MKELFFKFKSLFFQIWFQNRRARSKRNCTKIKNLDHSSTNQVNNYQQEQQQQTNVNLSPPQLSYWSY